MDKNIINGEMLVHIPMCTHKDAKKILAILADDSIRNELAKYDAEIVYSDSFNIDGIFDVVIYNNDALDDFVMANVMRNLDGVCGVFASKVISFDENTELMKNSFL